jgi:hypothetical protein
MDHALTRADLWIAIIAGGFAIAAALIAVQYTWHRQNRSDAQERNRKIDFILGEHVPHSHNERGDKVPLTTEGLTYTKHRMKNSST